MSGTADGRAVLLVTHLGRPEAIETARDVGARLVAAGIQVRVPDDSWGRQELSRDHLAERRPRRLDGGVPAPGPRRQ